uniref:hypothetical protein n=1 Tax=Mucilaginibacter sp. Bleaf8 TaxID=2834430 RepID=UPI001BCFE139|nr:hypothetical protein [Mucilaginibacter sp. Bleaf8]
MSINTCTKLYRVFHPVPLILNGLCMLQMAFWVYQSVPPVPACTGLFRFVPL